MRCIVCLAYHRHKQSLTAGDTGDEAIYGALQFGQQRGRDVPFRLCLYRQQFAAKSAQYPEDIFFVLMQVERACAIDQQSSRLQSRPHVSNDLTLQLAAFHHVLE